VRDLELENTATQNGHHPATTDARIKELEKAVTVKDQFIENLEWRFAALQAEALDDHREIGRLRDYIAKLEADWNAKAAYATELEKRLAERERQIVRLEKSPLTRAGRVVRRGAKFIQRGK
jgi:predicted RNase H-like nuclease (RuvC/YqgF family)